MCERRLLAVYSSNSAKLTHVFRVSRTGALALIFSIPSTRRSGLLLPLELRKAPFPYLERSEICAALHSRRNSLPLRDLRQTLLVDLLNTLNSKDSLAKSVRGLGKIYSIKPGNITKLSEAFCSSKHTLNH